jgi:hypothetical protein
MRNLIQVQKPKGLQKKRKTPNIKNDFYQLKAKTKEEQQKPLIAISTNTR